MIRTPRFHLLAVFALLTFSAQLSGDDNTTDPLTSFATEVRPILAANCFGCHQGARTEGGLMMTDFAKMMMGGGSGDDFVVAGEPDESALVEAIRVHDGRAYMPPNADPLTEDEINTIVKWVKEGAKNDYHRISTNFNAKNPPPYSRLPNITSLDYSPDGKLLAVTGFHEVLLLEAKSSDQYKTKQEFEKSRIVKRLVGLSARVESVKFSPDGKSIAVSGGSPGEMGEVQIWDVASGKLKLSKPVSHDTVYGVNWSPDGKLVSFGCTDTTLRAIDAETGKQVLFQGAHEDWIRDTVFSVDGKQLVSVGRDMTCKLTEVPTQRFIDNITSITPGVLKGGIASVARHPSRDEIVIGGSDGVPKVYRMNRITKRVIGDDANLVRLLPRMPGRIQSVSISRDGKRIAAGSSLDGKGNLYVYSYEFDPTVSDELKAILAKQPSAWNPEERKKVDAYNTGGVKQISVAQFDTTGVYATAFHPDGKLVASAGADGLIWIVETESGNLLSRIKPVEIDATNNAVLETADWHFKPEPKVEKDDPAIQVTALKVSPETIVFDSPTDYAQLIVQGVTDDGATIDLTPFVALQFDSNVISANGSILQPANSGKTDVAISYANANYKIPVNVELPETEFVPNFTRDVNPALTKLGCNAGTCHGSATGKMGFKLSLRGYDPIFDVRAFTDDMGSRRSNLASPHDSLMLLKPSTSVAHVGGQLMERDEKYYRLIHEWIRNGAVLDLETPKVSSIDVFPKNPTLVDADWRQQMRVVATYADGEKRDVTKEAFVEIGDVEVAKVDGSVVTALRRGESPILARYEGQFTATTLTVMGNRDGFAWKQPDTWGEIDSLVADKWQRMKIMPSGLCSDAEFIRRIYLDLTGLPPTVDQVEEFIADERPTREKRDEVIDLLIGNDAYVDHWANKWADLLQVNRKYLGTDGAKAFRGWIHERVKTNMPYNEFAKSILTASGSNKENPAASYFKIHRTPEDTMENTTHLFLATRFNCNKCHDHPFERWTQDQYFETAAFFAQVKLEKDPASGDKRIGGSAVEGAKPLYEIIKDVDNGGVTHERTGETVDPEFPFTCENDCGDDPSRREKLASWITSQHNPYFATSYVNRLWGYMLGTGLIEPVDDIRAGNPATNPDLLELLRSEFVESNFDTQHVLRMICKSRTYQLSIETNPLNADDQLNYSHAKARRLPAEVIFDSIHAVTGSQLMIPGVEPGTRAAALPDSGAKLPSGFLSTLGRPARESVCECERASDLQLGSVLALVSGPDLARAINDPKNNLVELTGKEKDDRKVVDRLYLQILNRPASDAEIDLALESFGTIAGDHKSLVEQRDSRKQLVAEELPKLEKEREEARAAAITSRDKLIKEIDPELIAKETARTEAIKAAEAELMKYKSESGGFNDWLVRNQTDIHWHSLLPRTITSTLKKEFVTRPDRSVLVKPKNGKDTYTYTSSTELTGISAVRLELLSDPALPMGGPGLADNGNLVLTEFAFEIAHPDRPDVWKKVDFESAVANYEQGGFPVASAFDGNATDSKGWALHGSAGKTSWATFQLKLPTGYSGGSLVRFKLHQTYDDTHQVGCFRIALTTHHEPIGLSLDEALLAELAKPEANRSDETKKLLTQSFEKSDVGLAKLKTAVATAKKPLTIDPKIVAAREKADRLSMPLPPDSILAQLEKDVVASEAQLVNKRLTAAQDLTWALINSPSFLFNR